jgi:hypothetical protein
MRAMYTPSDRERLRAALLAAARDDPRITGGAITGSASMDNEDRWSDIDLAFGVADGTQQAVLADFTKLIYENEAVLHHVDVINGSWVYRVFLLPNTLQVDLAFAPTKDFGARAPSFRLVFGEATDLAHVAAPAPEQLIGLAWLYALHVRSSVARGRLWQAEHMLSAMRDQVFALACVRHGLPAREARGIDRLPREVAAPLEGALVGRLDAAEIANAFRTTTHALLRETEQVDQRLTHSLKTALFELAGV